MSLPPILAKDYRRNVLWPKVYAAAVTLVLGFVGMIVFGMVPSPGADGGSPGRTDFVLRDGFGIMRKVGTAPVDSTKPVKVNAHLDDEEIARIREACR